MDASTFRIKRIVSRITQTDLSERSGIRNDKISRFESGQVVLEADEQRRLLDALAAIEADRIRTARTPDEAA